MVRILVPISSLVSRVGSRRVAVLLVAASIACVAASPAVAADPKVLAVERVAITVDDATKSIGFYRDVLGFDVVSDETTTGSMVAPDEPELAEANVRIVHMRLGVDKVDLVDWTTVPSAPIPADLRSNDHGFQYLAIVVRDMKAAYTKLQDAGVRGISESPQTIPASNPDAGGVEAYYFRDPDGHALQLIHFPPGKGEVRWQVEGRELFQGIDHTAIAVKSGSVSLGFYTERLGLHVAGRSEVSGIEQEKLSGIPGAHMRITGVRAPQGMGIGLVEYLSPAGGRPRPTGLRPCDLMTWVIVLGTPGVAPSQPLIRDPDGHLLRKVDMPGPPKPPGEGEATGGAPPL